MYNFQLLNDKTFSIYEIISAIKMIQNKMHTVIILYSSIAQAVHHKLFRRGVLLLT